MSHKKVSVTVAALVALAGAVALTVDVGVASARPIGRTQTFQARATSQVATATGFILADQDVHGTTVIGQDVLTCAVDSTGPACYVAFAQADGILTAHLQISDAAGTLTGRVHGGTGRYRHAHGTLSGTTLAPTAVQIPLHYCT